MQPDRGRYLPQIGAALEGKVVVVQDRSICMAKSHHPTDRLGVALIAEIERVIEFDDHFDPGQFNGPSGKCGVTRSPKRKLVPAITAAARQRGVTFVRGAWNSYGG